jgi:hypothetical protein
MRDPFVLFAVVFLWVSSAFAASPFDGSWKMEWRCSVAANGSCGDKSHKNSFQLNIWSQGNWICAEHIVTMGNQVDHRAIDPEGSPPIFGTIQGATAFVTYHSAFGGMGSATIKVEGGKLHWDVAKQGEGPSGIPAHAILDRSSAAGVVAAAQCSAE